MTSVRSSLNLIGQNASIRQLVQQRNESFPLSLRKFLGMLPAGRVLRKTIPLGLLQRKFDQFFNNRSQPLFKVSLDGGSFGQSALTISFDEPITGYSPLITKELAGPGEVLSFPGKLFGIHKFRFSDTNSNRFTLNVIPGQPVGIEAVVSFESDGVELRIEDLPNVDFVAFNINLKAEFSCQNGSLDLLGFIDQIDTLVESAVPQVSFSPPDIFAKLKVDFRGKTFTASGKAQRLGGNEIQIDSIKGDLRSQMLKEFINADVDVDVDFLPDGIVAEKIESTVNSKIFEALKNPDTRKALQQTLNRWIVGGDYYVTNISSDNNSLFIDYILSLGRPEPFAETPQQPLAPGSLANIDHIVVLMMENRSFDHMLGYLSKHGGRTDVDGLRGGEKNRYPLPEAPGVTKDHPSFPLPVTQFIESPCHDFDCVAEQVNGGKVDGFVQNFSKRLPASPGKVMGYYQAAQVPVYNALAQEFLICQRWFCSHPGPTMPNRFYSLTGRLNRESDGRWEVDNPSFSNFSPVSTRTIFDHLTDQGVSWRQYESGYCTLRLFDRYIFDSKNIVETDDPINGFFAAAQAGTLPSVSFIDPDFIDVPPGNDDHPPADIADGQRLVGKVVQALMNGPKWNKTMLVIVYDEHGGFFDHVPPPNATAVSGVDHYGPRVPAFVVSPWVDRGKVSNVVFDHTSILKTIARRFLSSNPPDLGERVRDANDLSMILRSSARTDRPNIQGPPASPVFAKKIIPPSINEEKDFHELLRMMRARNLVLK